MSGETADRRQGDRDMSGETAVRVDRLTRKFGDFTAVDAVTFTVARGEVFGFLGPNGAGKTTTIRMLTGLLPPTSGTGSVAGYDLATGTEDIKQSIGYMSQLFSLYADLTVQENITFFSGMYGLSGRRRDERRDWVLEMAGLRDHRGRLTRDLPLGWKQRLALGCAVIHEPPVLFLDEPTSGVDPVSRRNFWDLIYSLSAEGTTVFVSTHYMEEAEYCHRLALMNRGKLIALGTPRRLREDMKRPVLELSAADGVKAVDALQNVDGILEAGMFGRDVHVILEREDGGETLVRGRLDERKVEVAGIRRVDPSLEDVFIALVMEQGGAPVD
jgi:ABC-2 type transport system ATP-binding protein